MLVNFIFRNVITKIPSNIIIKLYQIYIFKLEFHNLKFDERIFENLLREDTHKKKWHGPPSHWCRKGKTLVVRPLKKNTF